MKAASLLLLVLTATVQLADRPANANDRIEVKAWEGRVSIPTYPWQEDVNPKFWALEGGARLSTTVHGSITYPYVMQDHLSRTKVDREYRALYLENEYLKVTCLPELGGRIHSVWDKTRNAEMFHTSSVIKPGMIAMRGAWISGGIEWNTGPHGHTVTILSPVDVLVGHQPDGSAFLEISNQEKIFRTRWTVRLTLHPGRAYLDEQIEIFNPTDGMHPYYFWNCTAFPNKPGTRFMYPMTLGTDHNFREFFQWPVDNGRDLTWLKSYETYSSIFAVDCTFDFFGAYDVDDDRGIVQVANWRELGGKKAWTWGEWDFGKVAQQNLTDDDGPYIEVQSGPLPTQSDYGMLSPRDKVTWREWWYPVHGLGDGFEFATRDLAAQTSRDSNQLELRLLATAKHQQAICEFRSASKLLKREIVDLTPEWAATLYLDLSSETHDAPLDIIVVTQQGQTLAAFTTPLPIPEVTPPTGEKLMEMPDEGLSVEQLYLKGRKYDRATQRQKAREYYQRALDMDPGHSRSLRALAVLDVEAGLYESAMKKLHQALQRDSDDGLTCYYLGVCHLQSGDPALALKWAYRATRCRGTVSLGCDLAGRAHMQAGQLTDAVELFRRAMRSNNQDDTAIDHCLIAEYAAGRRAAAKRLAQRRIQIHPTALVPAAVLALESDERLARYAQRAREFVGEDEFELLEVSLTFARLGQFEMAHRILQATCVDALPQEGRGFLPLYYLAWYAHQNRDEVAAREWLRQARNAHREGVFASRVEAIDVLQYAVQAHPQDDQAHLQLGCLLADLGRVDEAVLQWKLATAANPRQSIAWRNLGLAAASRDDLDAAEAFYRRAVEARPSDQTLYRDLAEILLAANRRSEAIELLESMPIEGHRRAEITVLLSQAYLDESRFGDCIHLLESTPYFVNWEGQDVTWRMFNQAHVARGKQRLEQGELEKALADFAAALTYPKNLNVGRSNKPKEAVAQYWRGVALQRLGRLDEARAAFEAGAAGADIAGQQNEYRERCMKALE
jgi:tetratricopeptide (TPR) repeat protein